MKIDLLRKVLLAIALTLAPAISGHAALVTTTLENVVIGNEVYDVTFNQDADQRTSFNQVYGADLFPELTFSSEYDASVAAAAVYAEVNSQDLDLTPAGDLNANAVVIPFAIFDMNIVYFIVHNDFPVNEGVLGPFGSTRTNEFGVSIATFRIKVCDPFPGGGQTGGCFPGPGPFPSLPEPATLALLGLGLAGLGFARRRKQ